MSTLNEKQLETLLGLMREEKDRKANASLVDVWDATCYTIGFEFYDSETLVKGLRGRLDENGDFPA